MRPPASRRSATHHASARSQRTGPAACSRFAAPQHLRPFRLTVPRRVECVVPRCQGPVANPEKGRGKSSTVSVSRCVRDGKPEAVGGQLVLLPEARSQRTRSSYAATTLSARHAAGRGSNLGWRHSVAEEHVRVVRQARFSDSRFPGTFS